MILRQAYSGAKLAYRRGAELSVADTADSNQ